jgi:hypothetical protein
MGDGKKRPALRSEKIRTASDGDIESSNGFFGRET